VTLNEDLNLEIGVLILKLRFWTLKSGFIKKFALTSLTVKIVNIF